MSRYRRANAKDGVFFFTVVLADRPSNLLIEEIDRLRRIYREVQNRRPFETIAVCILPDHIHALWAFAGARHRLLDPVEPHQEWLLPRYRCQASVEKQDLQARKRHLAASLLGARHPR